MPISLRALLLYAHVLALIVGVASALFADARIMRAIGWWLLRGEGDHRHGLPGLRRTQQRILVSLSILWVTGLGIVYLDFVSWQLVSSKLVLKLLCVFLLTVNGILLHSWVFPAYGLAKTVPALIGSSQFYRVVVLGGLSSFFWLATVFVGLTSELREHAALQLIKVFVMSMVLVFVGSWLVGICLRWHLMRGMPIQSLLQSD